LRLGFGESPQAAFDSGSQTARVLTEDWASREVFCPNCGNPHLSRFPANRPVADLYCASCKEEFELKSQKARFGARIANGAFRTMCERLDSQNNPNLMLVLRCVEMIAKREFTLEEVYAFESHLSGLYPMNQHVRQKIRQQLQVLRDQGFIEFLGRGRYRLRYSLQL
jgi:predicted RNA-binding Zn-ribbon protein involved in translation (DUF1610 family)